MGYKTQEEERVDGIVKLFQKSIANFDDLVSKVNLFEASLHAVKEEMRKLSSSQESIAFKWLDIDRVMSDEFKRNADKQSSQSSAILNVSNAVDGFKSELSSLKSDLLSVKSVVDLLSKQSMHYASQKQVEELKELVLSLSKELDLHKQSQKGLEVSMESIKRQNIEKCERLSGNLQVVKMDNDNLNMLFSSFGDKLKRFDFDLRESVESLKRLIDDKLDDRISKIPKPVIPSVDDIKKTMIKELEPVSFDAKNANLRSHNNETKLVMLEKKVEHLQLSVNSIKLV